MKLFGRILNSETTRYTMLRRRIDKKNEPRAIPKFIPPSFTGSKAARLIRTDFSCPWGKNAKLISEFNKGDRLARRANKERLWALLPLSPVLYTGLSARLMKRICHIALSIGHSLSFLLSRDILGFLWQVVWLGKSGKSLRLREHEFLN